MIVSVHPLDSKRTMVPATLWTHIYFMILSMLTVFAHTGSSRGLFAPRMDYDEWTPLGRGDPLKNDPTYDYVPPVLDRVSYWLEPEARTPDPPLTTPATTTATTPTTPSHIQETEMKKPLHSDSRRDNFDSLINFISDRRHSISRLRPHYIPVQAGYMAHRPAPELITVLMPPPPAQLPTSPVTQPPWDSTTMRTTETPPTPTEGTTFATPEATVSVHKVMAPMIDILPSGQQSLSSSLLQLLLQNEMATSLEPSSSTTSTTPNPSLTTDPLFSHYKQPAEPLRGPMYLIIQGHSKVKTYGASKLDRLSGIPIQDSNEVGDRRRRSRQLGLEDFLPGEEILEAVVKDYVDDEAGEDGSGLKQLLAAFKS